MIYETRVARVTARVTREGIIYLSAAESIHSTHSTHSEADSEQVTRIKGLRRGMLRSHGNGMLQGQLSIWIKKLAQGCRVCILGVQFRSLTVLPLASLCW